MSTQPEEFLPMHMIEKLNEYDRILSHPGYAEWRLQQITESHYMEDLTELQTCWLHFLQCARDDRDTAKNFILENLKREAKRLRKEESQYNHFLVQLAHKHPKYAARVLELFDEG